jgi:hypothetical protein
VTIHSGPPPRPGRRAPPASRTASKSSSAAAAAGDWGGGRLDDRLGRAAGDLALRGGVQPFQHRLVGRHAALAARGGDMVGQRVERGDDQVDQRLAQRQGAVADQVEHRFVMVREMLEPFMPEGARAALDRVDRAKDGVDRLVVVTAALQIGKGGFQRAEAFFAFLEEDLLDLIEIHRVGLSGSGDEGVEPRQCDHRSQRFGGVLEFEVGPIEAAIACALASTWRQACPAWVTCAPSSAMASPDAIRSSSAWRNGAAAVVSSTGARDRAVTGRLQTRGSMTEWIRGR